MKTLLSIYEELDGLYDESKYVLEFWMRKVAEREVLRLKSKNKKERTNYQLSLEYHGSSFRIRWFHIRFVKNGKRTIRVAKPIAIPRGHVYLRSKFKYADPWELDLICQVEEVLFTIRVKKAALMKAHQTLLNMYKQLKIDTVCTSTKDRVVSTEKSISKYKDSLL